MAEKEPRKAEAKPAAQAASAPAAAAGGEKKDAAKGGSLKSTPILVGVVMLLEAVVLFAGFKFLGGGMPKGAQGASFTASEGGSAEGDGEGKGTDKEKKKVAEVLVLEFKAPNHHGTRTLLYDIRIVASTKGDNEEKLKKLIAAQENRIQDRIRGIIASNDPEILNASKEPNLETLRRQVKCQLDEIIGEGMIDEVLVPRCIPYRVDF